MSVELWAYDPEICDGDFCPMCCDRCPKAELVEAKRAEDDYLEPDDSGLEMGFDPYSGSYTYDC